MQSISTHPVLNSRVFIEPLMAAALVNVLFHSEPNEPFSLLLVRSTWTLEYTKDAQLSGRVPVSKLFDSLSVPKLPDQALGRGPEQRKRQLWHSFMALALLPGSWSYIMNRVATT